MFNQVKSLLIHWQLFVLLPPPPSLLVATSAFTEVVRKRRKFKFESSSQRRLRRYLPCHKSIVIKVFIFLIVLLARFSPKSTYKVEGQTRTSPSQLITTNRCFPKRVSPHSITLNDNPCDRKACLWEPLADWIQINSASQRRGKYHLIGLNYCSSIFNLSLFSSYTFLGPKFSVIIPGNKISIVVVVLVQFLYPYKYHFRSYDSVFQFRLFLFPYRSWSWPLSTIIILCWATLNHMTICFEYKFAPRPHGNFARIIPGYCIQSSSAPVP